MTTRTYDQLQDIYALSDALNLKALGWLERNHALYLDEDAMLRDCAASLRDYHDMSDYTAAVLVRRAVSEFQARGLPFYIDVNESTGSQLALRDSRTGHVHFISIRRLATLTGLLASVTAAAPAH